MIGTIARFWCTGNGIMSPLKTSHQALGRIPILENEKRVNMQELKNALDQATKEIKQRFDFKDSKTEITLKEKEKELSIYFEYKKPGHFKMDCSQLKKSSKRYKKKAMMATWSESEDSSSEEE